MDVIPTAEQVLRGYNSHVHTDDWRTLVAMRKFAELHVKTALEAASNGIDQCKVPNCEDHTPYYGVCISCGRYDNPEILVNEEVIKQFILESYPLKNIK